ncbi:MAG: hypothetical protein QXM68_01800 [Candidatus Aenigmatarchaeota archaeon]|nr:hypothetical protein [Candidatus Aenigmarchaeota archaeon]
MLKKMILILILLMNTAFALNIESCKSATTNWVCFSGEICTCKIDQSCQNGNIAVYEKDIFSPLCYPLIKDKVAEIDLDACGITSSKVNVTAICDNQISSSKQISIIQRPEECIYDDVDGCRDNPDPLAENCSSGYACSMFNGECVCKKTTTTIQQNTTQSTVYYMTAETTIQTSIPTQTTTTVRPCPYECCDDLSGYEDKLCDEGSTCCPNEYEQYECRQGNDCFTKKASSSSGWIIILLITLIGVGAGAFFYLKKTKVNLQDKYKL